MIRYFFGSTKVTKNVLTIQDWQIRYLFFSGGDFGKESSGFLAKSLRKIGLPANLSVLNFNKE